MFCWSMWYLQLTTDTWNYDSFNIITSLETSDISGVAVPEDIQFLHWNHIASQLEDHEPAQYKPSFQKQFF